MSTCPPPEWPGEEPQHWKQQSLHPPAAVQAEPLAVLQWNVELSCGSPELPQGRLVGHGLGHGDFLASQGREQELLHPIRILVPGKIHIA